jgi:hypothetical protein
MLFAIGVVACLVAEAGLALVLAWVMVRAAVRVAATSAQRHRFTPEQMAAAHEVVERWKATQARIEAAVRGRAN